MKRDLASANRRDLFLYGEEYNPSHYLGGCRSIEALTNLEVKWLVENGYLDVNDAQNYSPTAGEFWRFLDKYPDFTAFGYAISPDREDYRITIEGIKAPEFPETKEKLVDFFNLCRFADELELDPPRAWWD